MKLHKHHRGLASTFIAASVLYYFAFTAHNSSAVMLNCSTAGSINVPVIECQGLVELFNNTNGASWTNSTNWNTNSNVCTWYGVGCKNIGGQDHVTRVLLPTNNLVGGPLPNSMSGLRYITGLDLIHNSLQGILPSSWSTWTGIQSFNISFNSLTGVLPSSWSTWTGIQSFIAGYNGLEGPLPTTRTGWKALQTLIMPFNSFTGTLPSEWGGWSSMAYLDLNTNNFTGALPASWSGWTNMIAFYMMDNLITGPLPSSWSTWTNLDVFYMYRNNLKGTLPTSWSAWNKIREFTIHHNQLTGSLPTTWSTWTGMQNFNVGANQLTGTLPSSWSTWKKIGYFSVGANNLRGTLPSSWSTWTGVTQFDVRQNYLVGDVPTSWTNMTSLLVGGLMINFNCLNTLLPEPPASFVDAQAEPDWQTTQYRCVISDLAVDKSSTESTATIGGGYITYVIAYANSGSMAVSGVMIYDDLPLGLNFVSASPAPSSIIGGSLSWNLGELLSMETGYIILTGQVDTNWDGIPFASGDTLNNAAYIYGRVHQLSGDDKNDVSFSNTVTLIDPDISSDLRIVKLNNNSTGLIGGYFSYTINYINSGTNTITGINIYDSLMSGLSFTSSFPAPTTVTGGNLVWNIGTLTPMQSGKIILTGYINPSFSSGDTLINTASIDGNLSDIDPVNNSSTTIPATLFDVNIPSDLIITKTVSGAANAHIGNFITYVINYMNSGASTITGVTIHDLLMTGLSIPDYDGATPGPTTITGFRDIFWDIGPLAPMQSGSIVMYIFVNGPFASGAIASNTATIDGYLSDVNPANNSSTTNVTIMLATGDISLTKSTTGTTIVAGSILTYDIYYRTQNNNLPEPIIISDILPAGLTYISTDFSDNPLNIDYTTGITVTGSSVTWQLWALTPSATGSFRVYMQVGAGVASGTMLTNTASITGDLQDLNRTNNTSTASPIRVFAPLVTGDLAVFKSASTTGVIPGQPITFTLTYMNSGSNTVTGVFLQDQMQQGFTYMSSNFTSGLTVAANTILESMGVFPAGSWSYSGTLLSWYFPAGIPANTSRTIIIQAIANTEIESVGGTAINIATITGSIYQDVSMVNNASFVYIDAITGSSATGGSFSTGASTGTTPSNPSNPDPRGYAGGGFGNNPTPNIVTLGSAPTLLDDEVCMYKDGDFERYKTTFKDIQNSVFKPAVDLMLDYCLVQGEYNGGKMFGVYNYLRWGEAYKVFSRLAGLSFSRTANPMHRSDRYRFAGQKVNLWASTTSQPHDPRSYIRYADIYTIGNNILKYYNKPLLEYDPDMNYNNAISRGKFALFMQNIINTIKQ